MSCPSWLQHPLKGLLLDIYGVLINSTDAGPKLIDGSLDAVQRLKSASIPLRFCTNESQLSQEKVVERLRSLGFPVEAHEVFSPIPAVKNILHKRNLRPYTILHDNARDVFNEFDHANPNCVVIGDAGKNFTYDALNEAFHVLMNHPVLITMGYGKFYKENDQLVLDVGAFSKALEFSCNVTPTIVGKPSEDYFKTALNDMGVTPSEGMMIGDDIVGDVGGAQNCGMRGVQVRTGKYRSTDEPHLTVKPDGYVDNLKEAVDLILKYQH
ncbi:phospholysine phosphohistidine inorganic pyrophosphate phosphatase-like isoform X2 [Hydractinia symbiolongicarpus]|uniref:phospholysine phosphohistidine inorganic pyrophosphate phosphatase-like isoform X2 n=1 Tax=Hydractinia symbiolongicarpus TaxID=13093 RepID=UPI00254D2C45|nr:phospholysine phosphohistidine inorganic pyrophosphate phosphatase-like isoform X2 [Hydractinia symbiolongicarpus]